MRTTVKTKRSGFDLLTTRGGRHTCLEWRENHTSNWFYLTRCEHVLWNPFERTDVLKTAALPRKESGDTHQNTWLSVFYTRTRHEKLLFMCFLLCVCAIHRLYLFMQLASELYRSEAGSTEAIGLSVCRVCVSSSCAFVHSCLAAVTRASLFPPSSCY